MDKLLFQNEFLAVIDRDGYIFSREVRAGGVIVSMLPFRITDNKLEFLARREVCPAHGPDPELYSITGGLEPGQSVNEAAQQELWEEAGYRINLDDLISLGEVRPSKSADTTVYLFAVNVTGESRATPPGDGTGLEAGASVEWVSYEQGIQIVDPLFVTALARLMREPDFSENLR